jgi:hypothetical protein
MAQVQHTVGLEKNFDHDETCDHCGKEFHVILRAQGTAQGSKRKAQKEAEKNLRMESQAMSKLWHRCTHCGYYSQRHLENMKDTYSTYRSLRIVGLVFLIIGAVSFGVLLVGAIVKSSVTLPIYILLSLVFISCVFGAWYFRPKSKAKYEQAIDMANDPEIIRKWLENWQDRSPQLLTKMHSARNVSSVTDPYEELKKVQHKYDPVRRANAFSGAVNEDDKEP